MTAKLIGVAGGGDEDFVIALDGNDLPLIETAHSEEHPRFSGIRMGSLEQAELVHALLGRAIKAAKTKSNGHAHAPAAVNEHAGSKKRPQRRRPRKPQQASAS
jgi:hypothetical protein